MANPIHDPVRETVHLAERTAKRRIVVLLDDSGRDCAALHWTLDGVRPRADELHVVRLFSMLDLPECWWGPVTRLNDDRRLAARTAVSAAVNAVRATGRPVQVSGSAVPRDADQALGAFAQVADEIVLSAAAVEVNQLRGLLRTVRCPLVVVPREEVAVPADAPIVLQLDRPHLAGAATAYAFAEATRRGRRLVIAGVWPSGASADSLAEALRAWQQRHPDVAVTRSTGMPSGPVALRVVPRWGAGSVPLTALELATQPGPMAVVHEPRPQPTAQPQTQPQAQPAAPARTDGPPPVRAPQPALAAAAAR